MSRARHAARWQQLSVRLTVAAIAGLWSTGGVVAAVLAAQQDLESPVVTDFMRRVEDYVALHRQLERTLPALPDDATPVQIDQAQRGLFALLTAARAGARRGDLFTPGMTAFVQDLLGRMFAGEAGRRLRASLMDENVKELPLRVNQRYPDEIPLATMPPRLLKALPTLPEQMEFRFVASQFVLLDTHAHLIVDFIPGALPAK
jgi:hypothetical protein